MSMDQARAFIAKVVADESFRAELMACTSAEERREFVTSNGYDFTLEEVQEARTRVSDEELDAVAGGNCCGFTCERDGNRPSCPGDGGAVWI